MAELKIVTMRCGCAVALEVDSLVQLQESVIGMGAMVSLSQTIGLIGATTDCRPCSGGLEECSWEQWLIENVEDEAAFRMGMI